MLEDFARQAVELARGLGFFEALLVVLICAGMLVLRKRVGLIKWPTPPPPSPDLVENPPSPPMVVKQDGSIPVANPVTPPDPGPM